MAYEVCAAECNDDVYDVIEDRLMRMSFWAHKEVLYEKIKDRIKKEEGDNLDQIAGLLIEASKDEMKGEQEMKTKRNELRDRLKNAFGE